jgi:hypothetical protein
MERTIVGYFPKSDIVGVIIYLGKWYKDISSSLSSESSYITSEGNLERHTRRGEFQVVYTSMYLIVGVFEHLWVRSGRRGMLNTH